MELYYCFVEAIQVERFTPLMKASLEEQQEKRDFQIRYSKNNFFALMKFTKDYAPIGYRLYNREETQQILNSPEWNKNKF